MLGTTIQITDKTRPAFNLFAVLTGAVTGITLGTPGRYPGISRNCREFVLQPHPDNGIGKLFIGDSSVSSANGYVLATASPVLVFRAQLDAISLADIYFTTDTNGSKLNVLLIYL